MTDHPAKISPIGGKHRSASSLLAEVMNDPKMVKCVVVTLNDAGDFGMAHYEMTRAEMTFAAATLVKWALED